jgi:hypothetical protein
MILSHHPARIAMTAVIFFGLSYFPLAQITIHHYPVQISCDVDGLPDLPPVTASAADGKLYTDYSEEIFSGGCLGTLVRTFTFTDSSGNKAAAQQFVSITDNQPPILYGEAGNISTTTEMIPEPAQFASRDNSGREYPVLFSEKRDGNTIRRTWTCTDDCGNTAEKVQVITLE